MNCRPTRFFANTLISLLLLAATQEAVASLSLPGLPNVTAKQWNETAVRKVLHTFALGAPTKDAQIRKWANMAPQKAIRQMLTFEPHNLLLSPPDTADKKREVKQNGSLRSLSDYWSSNKRSNRTPESRREHFAFNTRVREDQNWWSPMHTWLQASKIRGLNPFRAAVGFFETNNHMAVHTNGVSPWQMYRFYDDVMSALEAGLPYEEVIAVGAKSAAVARQYGHNNNWWDEYEDFCYCNEDFAREIHQLFFGILGDYDRTYHETITIKNTAKALTGMPTYSVEADPDSPWEGGYVQFNTEGHHTAPLEILGETIKGKTASEKIDAIAKVAIRHPESLDNLPLIIISGLADDNLDNAKRRNLQKAWRAMERKDLLRFLRTYAISRMFHNKKRIKYLTSIERNVLNANKVAQKNQEHFLDMSGQWLLTSEEGSRPFQPKHDVFGAQKGPEAANSARIFRINYNSMTQQGWRFGSQYLNKDWGDGKPYPSAPTLKRDWAKTIPKASTKGYRVDKVAKWLWQHLLADGHKNYGRLEQAYLHALLAEGEDFGNEANPGNPEKPVTLAQLKPGQRLGKLSQSLGQRKMSLDSKTGNSRSQANERIGQAINFILATPFAFAQEGK